jgi:hypothetical protein
MRRLVQTFRCLFPWRLPQPDARAVLSDKDRMSNPARLASFPVLMGSRTTKAPLGRRYFLPFVTRAVDARGGEAVFAELGLQTLFEGCWLNSRSAC